VFCYEGRCQRRDEVNPYTLALPADSNWGSSAGQVIYVDGTPSSSSLLGGMNEFIWDSASNQFEFAGAGLVRALCDVSSGDECYIGYGPVYDWDEYKLSLVLGVGVCLAEGVVACGHPSYVFGITDLMGDLVSWTKEVLPTDSI